MKIKSWLGMMLCLCILLGCKDEERESEDARELETEIEANDMRAGEAEERDTLVETISADPELSTFATGLNAWNVEDTIQGSGDSLTIFAPSNTAYSLIYRKHAQEVLESNSEQVIKYHLVRRALDEEDLKQQIEQAGDTLRLETVHGEEIKASMNNGKLVLTASSGDTANIVESRKVGSGFIHIIDAVLLPTDVQREVVITAQQ